MAGVIGLASATIYLAGVLGAEDDSRLTAAILFLIVMFAAGVLAWFADRSFRHGRTMALTAAGAFFVLGVLSSVVFAVIYLVATVFAVLGFAGTKQEGEGFDA